MRFKYLAQSIHNVTIILLMTPLVCLSEISVAYSANVSIDNDLRQNEFFVLPKLKLKTNKCGVSITIGNLTDETIVVKIAPVNPSGAKIVIVKDKVMIKPRTSKNMKYMLSFSKPYFGHIPTDLVEICSAVGALTEIRNTERLRVNIRKIHMPFPVLAIAIGAQFIAVAAIIGIFGTFVAGKFGWTKAKAMKLFWVSLAIVMILLIFYDIACIFTSLQC